ncbi:hypothetical protein [Fusobacterium ulcerans]|nr:hypothetical protein [Fusobacterium ulcerans]
MLWAVPIASILAFLLAPIMISGEYKTLKILEKTNILNNIRIYKKE